MKVIYEFNNENEDDMDRHQRYMRCDEAFSLLWVIDKKLRDLVKYAENPTEQEIRLAEEVREIIYSRNILDLWQ